MHTKLKSTQQFFSQFKKPGESVVDEFIQERLEAAKRESESIWSKDKCGAFKARDSLAKIAIPEIGAESTIYLDCDDGSRAKIYVKVVRVEIEG